MSDTMQILICECEQAGVVPDDVKQRLIDKLTQEQIPFDIVPDLCRLIARRSSALGKIAEADRVCIIACYPRAVNWLFRAAGVKLPPEKTKLLNMKEQSAEEIIQEIADFAPGARSETLDIPTEDDDWIPWFPVIDYDRCVSCHKCMDFCLFGVFGMSKDDNVVVKSPDNCKTNCPACARVCPEVAIIFPKYKASPINGDEVSEEDEKREPVNIDPAVFAAEDVYERLRRRKQSKKRFATDDDKTLAEEERRKALAEAEKELDIPSNVPEPATGRNCPCNSECCDDENPEQTVDRNDPAGCGCDNEEDSEQTDDCNSTDGCGCDCMNKADSPDNNQTGNSNPDPGK